MELGVSEKLNPAADPVGANSFAKAIFKIHKDAADLLASSRMNSLPQDLCQARLNHTQKRRRCYQRRRWVLRVQLSNQNAGSTAPSYFLLMKSFTFWLVSALDSFSIASV